MGFGGGNPFRALVGNPLSSTFQSPKLRSAF